MYNVCVKDYIDRGSPQNSNILFNSIEAARKFITEVLNTTRSKEYIEKLRAYKQLEIETTNQREFLLYRSYGMVDVPLHPVSIMNTEIENRGMYIYRIGDIGSGSPSLTFIVERKRTSPVLQ
jgi:hypothetical protein